MSKSIAKNLMYNILYQLVTVLMPLITVPYVSRILQVENIGTYSYTLSIVQYFIILGTLGISVYGNRSIAYVRDDKDKMSKTFWSIFSLNVVTCTTALIVFLFIFGRNETYGHIFLIQTLNIVAAIIDISWLYMGLEDFKKTVTRNLVVKIIGVACIFIFVKDSNDLTKYVFINGFMALCGNAVMWMYIPRTVNFVKVKISDIRVHFIPVIQLFIPQIAIQVYSVLDKTMIGVLANMNEVGLYEQSQKIVKLVLSLVTALGVVMLPRMSNIFASGDEKLMNKYLNNTLNGVLFVAMPMTFGLAGISNELVPWFFGDGFEKITYLMVVLSPILVLIAMSNVLGSQYLLPSNKTKEFTLSVTAGAIVNVILNMILITKYEALGACIATVTAEFTVTLIQYIYLRKKIEGKKLFSNIAKYLLVSFIMFIAVRFIGSMMGTKIITTVIQAITGIIIYMGIMYLIKDEMIISVLNTIKKKI